MMLNDQEYPAEWDIHHPSETYWFNCALLDGTPWGGDDEF